MTTSKRPLSDGMLSSLGVEECSASSRVVLTAADADHILRMSRSTGNTSVPRETNVVADVDHSDFILIHLFFCLLMSVYNCPGEFRRVLTQNWVSTWGGWTEASAMIESASLSNGENKIAE